MHELRKGVDTNHACMCRGPSLHSSIASSVTSGSTKHFMHVPDLMPFILILVHQPNGMAD